MHVNENSNSEGNIGKEEWREYNQKALANELGLPKWIPIKSVPSHSSSYTRLLGFSHNTRHYGTFSLSMNFLHQVSQERESTALSEEYSHQVLDQLFAKNLSACPPQPTLFPCPPRSFLCVSGSTCIRDSSGPDVKAAAVDASQVQGKPVQDRSDSRPSCRRQSRLMHRI